MKHLLLTTIAAVVLVGCATTQSQEKTPKVESPSISIHQAATRGDIKAAKQHLMAGVSPDLRAKSGWVPLHYASGGHHYDIVKLLIDHGANVDAEASGYTPLHNAAYRGSLEITKLLIVKGANINASDINGDTPLDWTSGEIADLLRKHGGKTGEELKAEGK